MHITFISSGTEGDARPFIALGQGLQRAGHTVRLCTHAPFETLIRAHGLEFALLPGDIKALMMSEAGHEMAVTGDNPVAYVRALWKLAQPLLEQIGRYCWEACQGTDVVVAGGPALFIAHPIAKHLGLPLVGAFLQPYVPTREFFSPIGSPTLGRSGTLNLLSHHFTLQLLWQLVRPSVLSLCQMQGWPRPSHLWSVIEELTVLNLHGYSPMMVPRPRDWGQREQIVGYWFLERPVGWQPSARLVDFLSSGPPPVYVGFGSMGMSEPEKMTALVVEALTRSHQRGILLSGWAGLQQADLPDEVLVVESVPHDWLFPQMAAVVHHGGAGTTAAALRAGVPSMAVPFFTDQRFWGHRLAELGVGPRPIGHVHLSVGGLTAALRTLTTTPALRARAATIGERIRAEEGVGRGVRLLEEAVQALGG